MKDVLLPVDVIETERRNLASPQAVRREQLEDGVVAYPGCSHVLPSDRERLRDVLGAERRGYAFICIHRWARDRTAQVSRGRSNAVQVAQSGGRLRRDSVSVPLSGSSAGW